MIRASLYKAARLLGDINAIRRGTVPQRLARRFLFAKLGGLINRLIPPTRSK